MHFICRHKSRFFSRVSAVLLTMTLMIVSKTQADEILAGPGAREMPQAAVSAVNGAVPDAGAGKDAAAGTNETMTEDYSVPAPFSVNIRFDETMEKLTKKDTEGWRWKTGSGYRWDDRKVSAYFDTLKEKYDTPYGKVNFMTHKGVLIQMDSSNCGWQLNTDASVRNLENGVDSGEQTVDPAWNSGLVYSSDSEVGDKYVEVSISEQKVFLFEDGKEVYETDCVTGTRGVSETEKGVFQVIYKASPSTLNGTDSYGNKYEQEVNYWIDFNGSQGMHDATWRSRFGGNIYETNGSHGCVNLPLEAAEKIYKEVYTYYPVIVY